MGTDSKRGEDRGTAREGITEQRQSRGARSTRQLAERRVAGSGRGSTQQLRAGARPMGLRLPPVARRPVPTFLLGPRRGHHEGHHQVQCSQEAGRRAPGTRAAASRGLQPDTGGRRGGGGGSGCSSSRPLPHPGRPGAAELEVRRDPSPRGDGSGAGAVVRDVAAVPEEKAVVGPGLGLPAWVRVRACVGARVSVTASASASPTKSRNGEAAGQARRAAILETGKDRGPQCWPLRGGAERRGPPPPCQHLGGPPVRVFAVDSVSSTPCPALRIPRASPTGLAGAANRTLSKLPGPGGGGRATRAGQELRWRPELHRGIDGSHVGDRVATLRSRSGTWAGPGRASDAGTNPGLVVLQCRILAEV